MCLTKPALAYILKSILLCVLLLFLVAANQSDILLVAAPMAMMALVFRYFYARTRRLEGDQVFANLGIFYALVVSVYVSLPLVGFILRGMSYGPGSSSRMLQLHPSTEQVGWAGLWGAVYLISFILAYTFFSRPVAPCSQIILTRKPPFQAVLIVFLLVTGFVLGLGLYLNLGSKTYLERYLAIWSLPLFIRQIANHISGISVIAVIGLLTHLFSDYRRTKFLLIALLGYELLSTVLILGGRSEVVQYLIVAGLLFHLCVKKLNGKIILAIVVVGLVAMLGYGVIRSTLPYGGEAQFGQNLLTESNEFESLFATLLELKMLRDQNRMPEIPWQLPLGDMTSLIPQQFLFFDKMDYANWYVSTFYPTYKGQGGGLAFGALAEAAVGAGLLELMLRAALLGWLFARIHRWYMARRDSFWATCFYMWIVVESYQCFRSTSFIILTYVVYRYLPYFIGVKFVHGLVSKLGRSKHQSDVSNCSDLYR